MLQTQVNGYEDKLKKKDEQIKELEKRLDDAEQYSRIDDVIITGLKPRHRAYSKVTAGYNEDDASLTETEALESQVIQFFDRKEIPIHSIQISTCHMLPRINKNKPPAITVRIVSRKDKVGLRQHGYKLKGTGVFVNEHLTKKNGNIAYAAWQLRKANKIKATWNCKVFIRANEATPEDERAVMVKAISDLDSYKWWSEQIHRIWAA